MSECHVCEAATNADPSNLQALVRWQAVKLDQARDALFPLQVQLGMARDRIRELEEIVATQNKRLATRRAS